jgi:hypothetical protein
VPTRQSLLLAAGAMAQAPPLTVIFPRQDPGTYQEDGSCIEAGNGPKAADRAKPVA